MRLIDKIALNSAIRTLTRFLLDLIKLFQAKKIDNPSIPSPVIKPKKRKKILPWRNTDE